VLSARIARVKEESIVIGGSGGGRLEETRWEKLLAIRGKEYMIKFDDHGGIALYAPSEATAMEWQFSEV
jgi:hypothetical protein